MIVEARFGEACLSFDLDQDLPPEAAQEYATRAMRVAATAQWEYEQVSCADVDIDEEEAD